MKEIFFKSVRKMRGILFDNGIKNYDTRIPYDGGNMDIVEIPLYLDRCRVCCQIEFPCQRGSYRILRLTYMDTATMMDLHPPQILHSLLDIDHFSLAVESTGTTGAVVLSAYNEDRKRMLYNLKLRGEG